ncbi:MAG: hypothetical protein QF492_01000 [Candidatus Krumholzibacteria bacterium]|nr:hypothetical protein [Candidatus Krumholzibacteria bacterium]MDP6797364.1 hypothetical protein [Candidatus Krumholzibacteria bacterium]MDP7021563.1 hypothetical protein [Candidatus Krumholzibacteria bacterium]
MRAKEGQLVATLQGAEIQGKETGFGDRCGPATAEALVYLHAFSPGEKSLDLDRDFRHQDEGRRARLFPDFQKVASGIRDFEVEAEIKVAVAVSRISRVVFIKLDPGVPENNRNLDLGRALPTASEMEEVYGVTLHLCPDLIGSRGSARSNMVSNSQRIRLSLLEKSGFSCRECQISRSSCSASA